MKFVHAADIHLDSPLRGLEAYEGAPVDEIRGATRRAVENLVELCLGEAADLLIIAGDLYDGDWRDYNTGRFFLRQVGRLTREGVRVVWVRGNHDAASTITRRLSLPEGAFEFRTRSPETHVIESLGVALHGQSYPKREVLEDLAARYPEPHGGLFNIGVLHTALDGRVGHDAYAPCGVERLVSRGYDYWALGHVHAREIVHEEPWIVFPGNLQGRHARETGAKGATVVRVDDGVASTPEHHVLDVVRWCDRAVDVSDAATADDVVGRVAEALRAAVDDAGDRLVAARIRLVGETPVDPILRRDRERWLQEIRLCADELAGQVWIERLQLETQAERASDRGRDVAEPPISDAPITLLAQALEQQAVDEAWRRKVREQLAPLESRLPAEYRALPDAIDFEDPDSIGRLLDRSTRMLTARLQSLGSEE